LCIATYSSHSQQLSLCKLTEEEEAKNVKTNVFGSKGKGIHESLAQHRRETNITTTHASHTIRRKCLWQRSLSIVTSHTTYNFAQRQNKGVSYSHCIRIESIRQCIEIKCEYVFYFLLSFSSSSCFETITILFVYRNSLRSNCNCSKRSRNRLFHCSYDIFS